MVYFGAPTRMKKMTPIAQETMKESKVRLVAAKVLEAAAARGIGVQSRKDGLRRRPSGELRAHRSTMYKDSSRHGSGLLLPRCSVHHNE